jgi:flagellar basal-body rod protein FlgG
MQESSYSAVFGALTQQHRLDTIANNLANVNTTGFKGDKLSFRDTFRRYAHDLLDPNTTLRERVPWPAANVLAQPRISEQVIDLSQGTMKSTGNALDLAIAGDGFFRVQTPEGEFMTRQGVYHRSAEGYVVDGHGSVVIDASGQVSVDGEVIDVISLVRVEDPRNLEKVGNSLLRIRPDSGAQTVPAEDSTVEQGFLEAANVEVVSEMVNMIEALRAFEAYQKMISGTFEQDKKAIAEVGAPR